MRRLLAATLLLLVPATALAWGSNGHRIVATIASQRLTPAARAEVERLLGDNRGGKSLASISMWADWARKHGYPETAQWHFVDIPLSRDTYDPGRDCRPDPEGDCVIAALQRMRDVLADRGRRKEDRVEALKFVVHLAADLHQPLHAAERDHDLGGNKVKVVWFGEEVNDLPERRQLWNLHAVWDDGMIAASGRNTRQYVVDLDAWLATQNEKSIAAGSVIDWALEAHEVARSQTYRDADGSSLPNEGARLGADYQKARIAALDRQLARAGVRLARMLNEALN